METVERQKVGVKVGDEIRLTGGVWFDRRGRVVEAHVDAVRRDVWVLVRLDNGMKVLTDGFEVTT